MIAKDLRDASGAHAHLTALCLSLLNQGEDDKAAIVGHCQRVIGELTLVMGDEMSKSITNRTQVAQGVS